MHRLLVPSELLELVDRRFKANRNVEDGLFLLARIGRTSSGFRLVAFAALEPPAAGWDRQGPDSLTPSAQWLSAAMSAAYTARASLVLVHSHPHSRHPAALSDLDLITMRNLAPFIEQITGSPFVLVAVKDDRWEGALSIEGLPVDLGRIDSVGVGLMPLSAPRVLEDALLDDRQMRALGTTNALIRDANIAVVGCGGTGAAVAEQLYRMGVRSLTLVDHDSIDTESNVRRMLGSSMSDASTLPHPKKVDVVARRLSEAGLPGTSMLAITGDIREERVFRAVLDADLVVCTTDTHGSRAVLNDMSYAYALPLIDLGARVSARRGSLEGLVAERRVLTLTRPCLWCTRSISPKVIAAENMDPSRRSQLLAEGYIAGGGRGHEASIVGLNVLAAALGACAVPGLMANTAARLPDRTVCDGLLGDAWPLHPAVDSSCSCHRLRLMADEAPIPLFASDPREEVIAR